MDITEILKRKYTNLDNIGDPESASILQRRGVGCHFDEHGLVPGPAAGGAGARTHLLFAPSRLHVRRTPPHVKHDGAYNKYPLIKSNTQGGTDGKKVTGITAANIYVEIYYAHSRIFNFHSLGGILGHKSYVLVLEHKRHYLEERAKASLKLDIFSPLQSDKLVKLTKTK